MNKNYLAEWSILILFIGFLSIIAAAMIMSPTQAERVNANKDKCSDNKGLSKVETTGKSGFRVFLCKDGTLRWK